MPSPKKSAVDEFVALTLAEFIAELALHGVPKEAAPTLAAAAYFYCPFPPVVESAWRAVINKLNTLSEVMEKIQFGCDGPNPDYEPLFARIRSLLEESVGAIKRESSTYVDRAGNVSMLEGVDGRIYAEHPDRNRDIFLYLSVWILNQKGKMTKEAAFAAMVDVINLLEGKRIAAASVKSAYVDIPKTYDWAKRPIDLSRLSRVLDQPSAKYLAVWKDAIKSPARVTAAPPVATTGSACANHKLTNWKTVPKWGGPDGPIAKWQKTGVPPNPDELPLILAPWTRAQFYRIFDGSQDTPPAPIRGTLKSPPPTRSKARRKQPR